MTEASAPAEHDDGRMSLMEHIGEFRDRMVKTATAVFVGALVGWFLFPRLLDFAKGPYCDIQPSVEECRFLQTEVLEQFSIRLTVAGYSGLALAMPVILWQLWRFITPGLHQHEKRYAVPFVLSGIVLFVLGASLAFWTVPRALAFLVGIGGEGQFETFFTASNYLSFLVKMMIGFGLGFEFPILLVFLQLAGLVRPEQLGSWRRYAVVAIVVLVAVITPSGDPFSLMVLSVPMYLFYEMSIILGRLLTRHRSATPAN
ncbi:MAG: twin-arginine translocase subunit TatC [Actinomycetia bacterium]|nr:twin-arginine translocase subunit TatC [Actinomycetes bacterium]